MIDIKKNNIYLIFFLIIFLIVLCSILAWLFVIKEEFLTLKEEKFMAEKSNFEEKTLIILPLPATAGEVSVEEALLKRRSVREYQNQPLSLQEASQVLWSAQGITDAQKGSRTAPSAGALYPLEIYLIAKKVEGLEIGLYHYLPQNHSLAKILDIDLSEQIAQAALGQMFIAKAPAILVISAVPARTSQKYGERAMRYVYMEAGHSAQNIYLQAESLGLGTVTVGAFEDQEVSRLLNFSENEIPLYIMPIGRSQSSQ